MYVYVANIWLHINILQNEVLHLGLGLGWSIPVQENHMKKLLTL